MSSSTRGQHDAGAPEPASTGLTALFLSRPLRRAGGHIHRRCLRYALPSVHRPSACHSVRTITTPIMPASTDTELIGAIDCGTTSSRFFIFDSVANVVAQHQLEFEQIFPHPGWMEERAEDLLSSIETCIVGALKQLEERGYSKSNIKGIGITNQRETTVVWSKMTGKALHHAIAWPDTRNTSTVRKLAAKSDKGVSALREKTGLPISTYFAGVKLRWLLDNVKEVREAHDSGDLMFGTVDTWLLWNYTGGLKGGLHLTDVTNASRTMFMDLRKLAWDDSLLEFFGVKREILPEIVSNSEIYGKFTSGPLEGMPIAGIVGDQQAALIGNKCLSKGDAKNTYGTGCFLLYNTGDTPVFSEHGLLSTPAYKAGPNAKPVYALEGSIAVGGSSVKWVRDNLGLIKESQEIGDLAGQVKDTGGVYFVTGLSGLFAPYWDDTATGMIIGLTGYTTKCHIARATLEATCFQTKAILDAMLKDSKHHIEILKVDGGMTNSDVAMQLQADILGIEVERSEMRESTALGSALMAGSALGLFGWDVSKPETLAKVNTQGNRFFKPTTTEQDRKDRYAGWNRAIERSKGWNVDASEREDVGDPTDPKVAKGG
ncbi:hypothetical protein E5Q_00588 [Mixia osmundae IAM 14324]|uniref:glycerol kinase n=1 Tax=Mixia osmundae (strain CBS 9802 / IAM 14324 / JCM 22182 / KY 12970) TaxID=764103 RepID=G7DT63_MIXOS|nr:hypothetical protein E5Q_00588 [Mixia osmundae IAM 14324]